MVQCHFFGKKMSNDVLAKQRKELAELVKIHKQYEALAFRTVNEPSEYRLKRYRVASLKKEVSGLQSLVNLPDDADFVDAFADLAINRTNAFNRKSMEVARQERERRKLEIELASAEPEIKWDLPSESLLTNGILNELQKSAKDVAEAIERAKNDVRIRMAEYRREVLEHSRGFMDSAGLRVKNNAEMVAALEVRKQQAVTEGQVTAMESERLDRDGIGSMTPVEIPEDPKMVRQSREQFVDDVNSVLRKAKGKVQQCSVGVHLTVKLYVGFDRLYTSIERVRSKVERMAKVVEKKRLSEHEKCMAQRRLQARDNLRTLMRIGRRCTMTEDLLRSIAPEIAEETKVFSLYVQQGNSTETNTGQATRGDIIRLRNETLLQTKMGERVIEENDAKRERIMRLIQAETERLARSGKK